MNRDPFFSEIVEALRKDLDPEAFERCACALLRSDFPTLVPVQGGGDSGLDGAVATMDGEPFPLVVTVGKNVIDNLTRNLKQYIATDHAPRQALLATSQALSPRRRENLFKRARDLGFTLLQVYDREAIAELLYSRPEWCVELLGLAGEPSALSAFPKSNTRFVGSHVIGRESELRCLQETQGDVLLVGQPGTGKTFILRSMTNESSALFAIRDSAEALAPAVRKFSPTHIIVDDAATRIDAIQNLLYLRQAHGHQFSIIASCWPGDAELIQGHLQAGQGNTLELSLMSRQEILQVIQTTGLEGPDPLIAEIITQSRGKPGLAVTLAEACRNNSPREVALGGILGRVVKSNLLPRVTEEGSDLLATISLGGAAGMKSGDAGSYLGLNQRATQVALRTLASGGVISERTGRTEGSIVVVQPEALRSTLIRDTFFTSPQVLDYKDAILLSQNLSATTDALVSASHAGANVNRDDLMALIEENPSVNAWESFAWLEKTSCSSMLSTHPELILAVAHLVLHYIPEQGIPLLLDAATLDKRSIPHSPDHPIRILNDWIDSQAPASPAALSTRQLLLDSTVLWSQSNNHSGTKYLAFGIAMSPSYRANSVDPGAGNTFRWTACLLPSNQLQEIAETWTCILADIEKDPNPDWTEIFRLVREWGYPSVDPIRGDEQAAHDVMREHVRAMLTNLIDLPNSHPGVTLGAIHMADLLGIDTDRTPDSNYVTLYGRQRRPEGDEWDSVPGESIESLVNQLDQISLSDAGAKLIAADRDMSSIGHSGPRRTPVVLKRLLDRRDIDPSSLCQDSLEQNAEPDLIHLLLSRSIELDSPISFELVEMVLQRSRYKWAAIAAVVRQESVTPQLMDAISPHLHEFAETLQLLIDRGELSISVQQDLLSHPDSSVASNVAVGIWLKGSQTAVDHELYGAWEQAIIGHVSRDYWLIEVLESDPGLSRAWLQMHISCLDDFWLRDITDVVEAAVSVLSRDERYALCATISPETLAPQLVRLIIDADPIVYQRLIDNPALAHLHLAALPEPTTINWQVMAEMAIGHGYTKAEVGSTVLPLTDSWMGPASSHYQDEIDRLAELARSGCQLLAECLAPTIDRLETERTSALKVERFEAVYGRGE